MPASVVEYGTRRTLVVGAVMLAALIQLADTTIVNVALPTIDGALGASVDEGAWFVTAYIIANVIFIPLSPWFQTLLGRKNYFALSIAGFTITSVLCGLTNDSSSEIGLRFLQGAFGGGLMVPAQQIMRDTFPAAELAKSQSLFALAVVLGPTLGPTLGGLLTDNLSWRWVFFVNVLPGVAATILVLLFLRDPMPRKRVPFDVFGVALLAVGLGTLQYVLDEGERDGWFDDTRICLAAVVSVVTLVGFVVWELFGARTPGVALRTFRHRTVWALAVIYFAVAGGLFASIFVQPQWAQTSLGFTTTLAGMLLMVRTGVLVLLYPVTTWVTSQAARWDMRLVAAGGLFLAGLGPWLQADVMTTHTPFIALVATQLLGGVGYAFIWVPLSVVLFKTVPQAEIPSALALTRLVQQIGASVGSAYAATLLDRSYDRALNTLAGSISLHSAAVASLVAAHGAQAIAQLSTLVSNEAQNIAATEATRFFALATMLAAVLPFLLKRYREQPAAPQTLVPPTMPATSATPASREALPPARELALR
ncbi:MAG TPA: DHA2 family efflux MFS transporter permease subunit [Candidatus Acidoferrales bacterium]|nr:DHA2 family efflux MFS transporter permease subunit [Candidatus Acidoferrales bacterium]